MSHDKSQEARIVRRSGYVALPNAVVSDTRLSIEARGLLCFMMSCAADWTFRPKHLMAIAGVGRDKYFRMLGEIKDAGYLEIRPTKDADGRFTGAEWHLNETGFQENQCPENPRPENQDSGEPAHLRIPIDKKPNNKKGSTQGLFSESQEQKTVPEILTEAVSADIADEFIKHRKALKKPMTEFAADRIIKQLDGLTKPQADEVVGRSIENGWAGVFPKSDSGKPNFSGGKAASMDPTVARVMRQKAEEQAERETRARAGQ